MRVEREDVQAVFPHPIGLLLNVRLEKFALGEYIQFNLSKKWWIIIILSRNITQYHSLHKAYS